MQRNWGSGGGNGSRYLRESASAAEPKYLSLVIFIFFFLR